jgi:hypothetical protein
MDAYPKTSNAQPPEGNPAFSAGLEAGLVGAVLVLVNILLVYFIQVPTLGLALGILRVCIWLGVGALAVFWLKGKGSIVRSDQIKATLIAALITALVTSVLLVIFGYIQSESIEEIPVPEGVPSETYNEFLESYEDSFSQIFGISLICCVGLPTFLLATGFTFGGGMLMSLFVGGESPAPIDQPYPPQETYQPEIAPASTDQAYPPQRTYQPEVAPEPEPPPTRLEDFLSVEGLPLELHTSVAAYKRGELDIARPAFVRFLRENPKHAYAWLWMSVMIPDPVRQEECIRRALAIEPYNETARKMLAFLQSSSSLYGEG